MAIFKEITAEEKKFITENYKSLSVPQMAKKLKRGSTTVYGWLEGMELKPKERDTSDHPFRVSNRRLEALLIECKKNKRV